MSMTWRLVILGVFVMLAYTVFPGAMACDDRDRDNTDNSTDNCAFFYNPGQTDEDGDSEGDACDEDTPQHEFKFARCYQSTFTPDDGKPPMSALPTAFLPVEESETEFTVKQNLPPDIISLALRGDAITNGERIWYMSDNKETFTYWALFAEGEPATADEENIVQTITGVYTLLKCPNCFGDPDAGPYWENWTGVNVGTWEAVIEPPEFCEVPADDDTADDDTSPADDDESPNDDDDATDDDDQAPAPSADDDDDSGGCGC